MKISDYLIQLKDMPYEVRKPKIYDNELDEIIQYQSMAEHFSKVDANILFRDINLTLRQKLYIRIFKWRNIK